MHREVEGVLISPVAVIAELDRGTVGVVGVPGHREERLALDDLEEAAFAGRRAPGADDLVPVTAPLVRMSGFPAITIRSLFSLMQKS